MPAWGEEVACSLAGDTLTWNHKELETTKKVIFRLTFPALVNSIVTQKLC